MRAVDVIIKKRDGLELNREEIAFFIHGYTQGDIPDYQAAAWAMAVLLNGMNARETTDLTLSMAASGDVLDLSDVVSIVVDKHSTGGVGDKTTLVVAPLVAACGLPVGKMSGRSLGFSGGTIDKLETIPGFRADLKTDEFINQLREIGIVLTGQSADLAPADGKLYALRDVTGTVQSLPLIASSIMSKKIAGGAQAMVLDVKIGLGAFMPTLKDGRQLAELMVNIAQLAGRKAIAILSDMNQPLGHAVGNSLELHEAIQILHDSGPADFREHCIVLATHMLILGKLSEDLDKARVIVENALRDGSAWKKFRQLIIAQGGNVSYVDDPSNLPKSPIIKTVPSPVTGHILGIHAREVGEVSVMLGAGRLKKGDPIDHAVGIIIHHKVGDFVEKGQPLFTIHAHNHQSCEAAHERLLAAHAWTNEPFQPLPLFYGIISQD